MSKPTLYVYEYDSSEPERRFRPASRRELLDALNIDYEAAARVRQAALVERAAQKGIVGIKPWDEITDDEYRELRLAEARRDVAAALGVDNEEETDGN